MRSIFVRLFSLFFLVGIIACEEDPKSNQALVSQLNCPPVSEANFLEGLGLSQNETYVALNITLSNQNFPLDEALSSSPVDDVLEQLLLISKENNHELPIKIYANLTSEDVLELTQKKMIIFEGLKSFSEGPARINELNQLNNDYEMTFELGCQEAILTSKSKTLVPERSDVRTFKLIDNRSFYTSFENLESGRELPLDYEFSFTYLIKSDTEGILVPPVLGQLFANVTPNDFDQIQVSSRVVDFFPLAELSVDYVFQRVLANQEIGSLVYNSSSNQIGLRDAIQRLSDPRKVRVLSFGGNQK